ncbi:MAG TPA: SDR family NAD(P)-dependent oxidoreductase [Terriglobia bacterium]|nr:SDR family NAD(P)-dependent oxidoreductase [Terriglobia bacterium]
MRLENRVALVTGMAMGIGKGIAELFAAEGAAVVGLDVNEKGGTATRDRIRAKGGRCSFRVADVSSEKDVQTAVEAARDEFGPIDVLINVVGIASEAPAHEMELADWDRILRVNLTSMFLTSKHVLPGMLALGRGSIVHITSVQALLGFCGYPHYAASKGGIISLTRQMAREYATRKIRVNCIAPGTVETPLNVEVLSRSADPKALRAAWEKMHPIGRLGQPIDIAYGALYLACDESSWVTGQCLVIDGGLSTSGPV